MMFTFELLTELRRLEASNREAADSHDRKAEQHYGQAEWHDRCAVDFRARVAGLVQLIAYATEVNADPGPVAPVDALEEVDP